MANANLILYIIDRWQSMNRKLRRELLPKNIMYTVQNARYDNTYGNIEKRLTRSQYNSASLGVTYFSGLYRYYKNTTDSAVLITLYNGTLSRGYDAQGVFSVAKSDLNPTYYGTFLTYKDLCYIFNGTDTNLVFTFVNATGPTETMGCPSFASVPSITLSTTAGNIYGPVNYAIAYQFDGYQEGNAGASTASLEANGSQARVTVPTFPNTRCTGFYIYRTKSSASTLYRVAAVTNNTAAYNYTDNTADTSLDLTKTAPIDYGLPPRSQFGCIHKERLFLNDMDYPSDIPFSDIRTGISYPDVFPSTNRLYIARGDSDKLTFILNDHIGQLIAAKTNSIRIINTSADSPIAWDISDSFSTQGCISWRTAQTTPIGIVYLTRFGELKKRLVLWAGAGIKVMPELEGLEPILTAIPEAALDDVVSHYHNGYYYLAYHTEGLYNDKVLVINLLDWSWEIDTKNVSAFCSWNGGNDFGELYTGTSDTSGKIIREDADQFDLLLRRKSEFDGTNFTNTETRGTEASPILGVNSAAMTAAYAGRTWASMTGAGTKWEDMTSSGETWWYAAEWIDIVRDISARAFSKLLWTEVQPAGTEVVLYLRAGDTEASCEAAAWNGPYSDPIGSDISAISAYKYIQLRASFAAQSLVDCNNVYLQRSGTLDNDYVIKVSCSYGDPYESTVEFDMQSGRITLGDLNDAFKRVRKRLRTVKIEYDREDASGNFDFSWYLDGTSSATGTFNTDFATYSKERTYNFPLTSFCEDFWYRIYTNTDTKSLKIKRIIFTVSTEKYYVYK